jgi:hypothetical protein
MRSLSLILLLIGWTLAAHAQPVANTSCIAFGNVVNGASITCNASGVDREAIMGVVWLDWDTVSVDTITYGPDAGVLVNSHAVEIPAVSMYHRTAPAIGPQTYEVVLVGFSQLVIGTTVYTGVHQTTPLGTSAKANGTSTTPSVTVPSAVGELAVDVVGGFAGVLPLTVTGGQTQQWQLATTLDPHIGGASSTRPGAAPTVAMNWTGPIAEVWSSIGVSLKPVAVAAGRRRIRNVYP